MRAKVRIIFTFCLSIVLLVLIGAYAYRTTHAYKGSSEWVNHTQQTIAEAQRILLEVQDIETSQRGFVITGEDKYLAPYNKGLNEVEEACRTLREKINDNAEQLLLLDSMHAVIERKIEFSRSVVAARKSFGFDTAQQLVTTGVGENLMREIRSSVERFVNTEETLLSQRLEVANADFSSALNIILASIALAVTIVLITLYFFLKDFNRRVRSEKKVKESESRIKKFLGSLPLGVFVVDAKGKPFYANERSKEILGQGIVPGTGIKEMARVYRAYIAGSATPYPSERQPMVRVLGGEKNVLVEDVEIDRDGKRIPLRINATAITDSEGVIEYAISVFDDITDVREAERNLKEAKRMAEESATLKEAFLANMSHEIRTPLNAIIGFTDVLLKREIGTAEMDYVRTIKTSGENLLRIISDVLDVSKIESGMMTFETHPLNIRELFVSLQAMMIQKAQNKELDLRFGSSNAIPNVLAGDPTRLTQILFNLVGNAIKFTNTGSVSVNAMLQKQEGDVCFVEFTVSDTGIGIPEEKLQHIFERFTQAEAHTSRHYGGTGLGLSIAKQLVELQGGSISVASTPGKGSVFTFVLPFSKTIVIPEEKEEHTDIDMSVLRAKKILLVEDNPVNVKFVQTLFAEYNMVPDVAENGLEAIAHVRLHHYDLVLMDIEMPGMNGYDATRAIRTFLKSEVPIIAMTAHAMAGEREKCLEAGMNAYVPKPIREKVLLAEMWNLTEGKNSPHRKVPTATAPPPDTTAEKLVDLGFLVQTMRGKKEVIRETIDIFLHHLPEDMYSLSKAMEQKDFAGIRHYAHKIKSSVSLMGIKYTEALLQEMEIRANDQQDISELVKMLDTFTAYMEQAVEEVQAERQKYV